MITQYLRYGIISKAVNKGIVRVNVLNLRSFSASEKNDGRIDEGIFGHGKGMLFRPEPLFDAVRAVKKEYPESRVVYMTPRGRRFDNIEAKKFSLEKSLILLCGRYEGIDSRIVETIVDDEISIGDYVLTGGELPALVVLDSVCRFLEGSIKENSKEDESFEYGLLEYDHYTQPLDFLGKGVPEALRSGDHRKISIMRYESSLKKTYNNRIDLLHNYNPVFITGETKDPLKKLMRINEQMKNFLLTIQNISKEWKNGRRN
jgi:tRNA (guanine37-N1)-methyltransferase